VAGWVNVDGSWSARIAKHPWLRRALKVLPTAPASLLEHPWSPEIVVHDVRKRLPFRDATFSAVYASHLLEHLYFVEAERLLADCYRLLRPGGVIRLVVPDLRTMVNSYISGKENSAQRRIVADELNRNLLYRDSAPPRGGPFYRAYSTVTDFHSHKWMYDADSLTLHLEEAGFVNVREKGFHDSVIDDIAAIEEADRVLEGAGICIEGYKPGTGL
jgi:SAM-dependent methyltransferase